MLVDQASATGASQFTPFLAEMLRTEGLNEFATADLSTVTAATLAGTTWWCWAGHALTAAQVSMFTHLGDRRRQPDRDAARTSSWPACSA